MTPPSNLPTQSEGQLKRRVLALARETGVSEKRIRDWIGYTAIGAALRDANNSWIIKGGVALEMRRQGAARATRDLDLIFDATTGDFVATIEDALRKPYGRFSFRRTGNPTHLAEANTWRINIAVRFNGSDWTTVSVDITPRESFGVEIEWVDALEMQNRFDVQGPLQLPCLSLRFHIAQKLHGMTVPDTYDHRNDRARDAADVLLFLAEFESPAKLLALHEACLAVFESRNRHPWPPAFAPPERWREEFERIARFIQSKVALHTITLADICGVITGRISVEDRMAPALLRMRSVRMTRRNSVRSEKTLLHEALFRHKHRRTAGCRYRRCSKVCGTGRA